MFKIKSLQKGGYVIPYPYCQAHEPVRIKTGSKYMGIDGKLTSNIDEAMLVHPDHFDQIYNQIAKHYSGMLFITETNRKQL